MLRKGLAFGRDLRKIRSKYPIKKVHGIGDNLVYESQGVDAKPCIVKVPVIFSDIKEDLIHEAEVLERLAAFDDVYSPELIELGDDGSYLVQEKMGEQNLNKLFLNSNLTTYTKLSLLKRGVEQVLALAARGEYHHDLKPSNFVADKKLGLVSLIDFSVCGPAKFLQEHYNSNAKNPRGTLGFISPVRVSSLKNGTYATVASETEGYAVAMMVERAALGVRETFNNLESIPDFEISRRIEMASSKDLADMVMSAKISGKVPLQTAYDCLNDYLIKMG